MPDKSFERPSVDRALIWARPERSAKGPAPARSRNEIAAAAVALADAHGIEAVSMRKLAATLTIGAASLYSYVLSKDELHDLMVDWVEGADAPLPPLTGDWRADLTDLAHRIRRTIHRHPWLTSLAAGRPSFGPNSLASIEHGLAAMDALDLSIDDKLVTSEALHSFVRGFVTRELAEEQALQRGGLTAEAWGRAARPYMESIIEGGLYPRFAHVVRDAQLPHEPDSRALIFSTALNRVLNGLIAGAP
ncbi:TetR/AcrR family transcriptional regulator [Subtercola lobariae]|uniref:TetR family transcriptional regulator n=1 Tax=Subtercola lobariae TaxID=1588641 RepID=A0A917BD41_9MICO|nr:TetR/AcrR family transcriptional regulator C-terminal domain-containing protein [Subtercola lobariae]GGF37830.1 TetR family transcriptional regulator [Subtercola lobariae]